MSRGGGIIILMALEKRRDMHLAGGRPPLAGEGAQEDGFLLGDNTAHL